jgi:hypothetical protein
MDGLRRDGSIDKGFKEAKKSLNINGNSTYKFEPHKAGFFERLKYESVKLIYGEYPPHSSLNYIWANKKHQQDIITSAYTEKSKMILLQKGDSNVGKWVKEDVNIIADYRKVFGAFPPAEANIAVMNDSDNTGEKSISYFNYIRVYNEK